MSDALRRRLTQEFHAWAKGTSLQGLPPQTMASVVSAFMGDLACRVLTEGVEIVTPHREGCRGGPLELGWLDTEQVEDDPYGDPGWVAPSGVFLECAECPFQARIPEALLVELAEAKDDG